MTQTRDTIFIPYTMSAIPDPLNIFWSGDWTLANHAWQTLIDISENGSPKPKLAEKWKQSPDGLKWVFFMRPGLKSFPVVSRNKGISLAFLQSADPKIHVCCGRITNEESGCCVIGLGADIHESVAEEKALHEVCLLHKHWNPKENTSMLLATHWYASEENEVARRLKIIFSGSGKKFCYFVINPKETKIRYQRNFSPRHHVVRVQHPHALSLTFGEKWAKDLKTVICNF